MSPPPAHRLRRAALICVLLAVASPCYGQLESSALEPLPALDEVLQVDATPIKVEADPTPDYSWYQPAYYLDPEIWDGSIEVGINGASGNTDTFSITAGYDLKRETKRWDLSSDLKYFNTSQNSVQTQNYAILNVGAEWKSNNNWTAFGRSQLQYNEFQKWDLRLVLNSGLGYKLLDDDVSKLKVRFGAGASREFGGIDNKWVPEAVLGANSEQKLSSRQKIVSKFDYFPSWSDLGDYRMVSDLSWQIVLDEETNLSLKVGVVNNVDSTPAPGFKAVDTNYVVLLLWKL
ncbi:MAG: DUF481 domain-containing protein [Planctomycetales bacterium]|nr:DUF481 domain-containing protein [Planctomycetales bacterium]